MSKSLNRRDFFKLAGGAAAVAGAATLAPSVLASSATSAVLTDSNGVGVYNEWDQLKSIIVGTPEGFTFPKLDWVLDTYAGITDEVKAALRDHHGKTFEELDPAQYAVTKAEEDALAALLKSEGIEVIRPTMPSKAEQQAAHVGYTAMFERDNTLAVGDELINIFCRTGSRRKVHPFLHKQLTEVTQGTGQAHISQPVPALMAELSDEDQPYLEGGDIFVLGKDILVGHAGIASSYAGIEWLQKHLEPKGYRVHTIELTKDWIHLDCIFSTPREGLAMAYLGGVKGGKAAFPEFMQNWTWLEATKEEAKALGCNGVNIAPSRTIIGAEHTRIIEMLTENGVECVTLPYANVSAFGGGPRCSTHPLVRKA
ncbi:arginine deiminase family protein [Agarivorans sp. Alg241-V36]|uniref:arginine deiminase family protein n=1 Tax=Agarivorans sp. Alg241-V36 TaxID=2305992 RepID=UPI0013D4C3A4|nr:arginine deiminase family protein [Agarivorans sp. Alg241-V36]